MATVWLGVDVAKANFVAEAVAAEREEHLGQFANNATGFAAMAELVSHTILDTEPAVVHLVVEPTGGYELALVAFAYAQGWMISLPNPRQVRNWGKGMGQRAKTDGQDARMLAQYGAACHPLAQPPLAGEVSELDSLLKRRRDLEQMLQQEKNRRQELAGRPGIAGSVETSLAQVIEALQEALRQVAEAIQEHLRQYPQLQQEMNRLLALPGIVQKSSCPCLYCFTVGRP